MSDRIAEHERVYELTAMLCDGSIDAPHMAELDRLLAGDAAARLAYMRYLDLHAEINRRQKLVEADEASAIVEPIQVARVSDAGPDRDPDLREALRSGLGGPRGFAALHLRAWGVAIAAAVVVAGAVTAAIVATMSGASPAEQPKAVVGVVLDSFDAFATEGRGDATPLTPGAQVHAGELHITSGVAEIEMSSGAVMRVEGPAQITMVNAMTARLRSGRIAAHVPAAASGFAVQAPGFKLTDLGTEFGMSVEPNGAASVFVFDGTVRLDWPSGDYRIITAGGGTAIAADGAVTELSGSDAGGRVASFAAPIGRARGVPVTSGMIGYWRFDGLGGSAQAKNLVPGGKLGGIALTGGRFIDEDGATGFELGGNGRGTLRLDDAWPAFTVSMLVRIDALTQQELTGLVMTDRSGAAGTLHWQIDRSGTLVFHLYGDDRFAFDGAVRAEDLGRWMRLTVSYDGPGSTVAAYRDGTLIERRSTKVRTAVSPGDVHVGQWSHDGGASIERTLNGALGDLIVYQRAITEQEAARLGGDREQD